MSDSEVTIQPEELITKEEDISLLKNDSVNADSSSTTTSNEKQPRKKAKQNNSITAWMCRMWFIIGLMITWPIAYSISMPVYFLHKYLGFDAKKTWLGKIFRSATAMVIKSNPYWKLSIKHVNKNSLPTQEKKTIFVCNHQSNMDPFVLISGALPIETKWVSKSDLFSVPFAGRMMKNAGDVPIVFKSKKMDDMSTDRESVKSAMNKLKEHLHNDSAVFFFPEGRRSSTPDQLMEWKKGASIMSLETGADIVPIALYGTFTMWGLEEALPTPGKAAIVVGEPISVKGMTLEKDVDTLNEMTREAVAELLQKAMAEYAKM